MRKRGHKVHCSKPVVQSDVPQSDLVSVIVPVYNRGTLLRDTLESVLSQTYRPLELIIVDDGSAEDIHSIVEHFKQGVDFPVTYIRQTNQGPGVARKVGLQHARGEFIQYLDSDDLLMPVKIELQVSALQQHPEAVMCYCQSKLLRLDGQEDLYPIRSPTTDLLEGVLNGRPWFTSTPLWRYSDHVEPVWPATYDNEDITHDISVGLTNSQIIYLPSLLVLKRSNHSDRLCFGQDNGRVSRFQAENMYRSWDIILSLVNVYFTQNPKLRDCYSMHFLRRIDQKASTFLRAGSWDLAAKLLIKSTQISSNLEATFYVLSLGIVIRVTAGKVPKLYRGVRRAFRPSFMTGHSNPHQQKKNEHNYC